MRRIRRVIGQIYKEIQTILYISQFIRQGLIDWIFLFYWSHIVQYAFPSITITFLALKRSLWDKTWFETWKYTWVLVRLWLGNNLCHLLLKVACRFSSFRFVRKVTIFDGFFFADDIVTFLKVFWVEFANFLHNNYFWRLVDAAVNVVDHRRSK